MNSSSTTRISNPQRPWHYVQTPELGIDVTAARDDIDDTHESLSFNDLAVALHGALLRDDVTAVERLLEQSIFLHEFTLDVFACVVTTNKGTSPTCAANGSANGVDMDYLKISLLSLFINAECLRFSRRLCGMREWQFVDVQEISQIAASKVLAIILDRRKARRPRWSNYSRLQGYLWTTVKHTAIDALKRAGHTREISNRAMDAFV